jgi:hypothetical protein
LFWKLLPAQRPESCTRTTCENECLHSASFVVFKFINQHNKRNPIGDKDKE